MAGEVEAVDIVCCAAMVVHDCVGGKDDGDSEDSCAGVWLLVVSVGVRVVLVAKSSCTATGVVVVGKVIGVCE